MSVILWLTVILFILMKIVGGDKGIKAFFALFLNFAVFSVSIIVLSFHKNVLTITLIACAIICVINLFFISEINAKTMAAFISTITTLLVLILFIFLIEKKAMIQGFGEEEGEEIGSFSLYIGINFTKIAICTLIMSTIAAIIDISISISSSMNELFAYNPSLSKKNLFYSGLNVGRDILGTTTNTLYFAFLGGYLTLILWFKSLPYSFGDVINSKVFSSEVISILTGGIGVAISIPVTAWISAYILAGRRRKKSGQTARHSG